MAWRIHNEVVRGEIDNLTRGRVTGRIWFRGRDQPVVLSLAGNCALDLVGRKLEFVNPRPTGELSEEFAALQNGWVGEMTASRRVRVPEISTEELAEYHRQRKPFPWHWGNSVYLEWSSEYNGGVTIESADFEIRVSEVAAWTITPHEHAADRKLSSDAFLAFSARGRRNLDRASAVAEEDTTWKPQTEEEAEAMQARSDLLSDRIHARMEQEGESADYEKILGEELERARIERGEPEPTEEELEERSKWIEEANRAGEEALKNPDPEIEAELAIRHPLAQRAFELAFTLRQIGKEQGWVTDETHLEHPVMELIWGVTMASAKLAGALNGKHWPPDIFSTAGVLVRLKRARGYLEDAMRGADGLGDLKLQNRDKLDAGIADVSSMMREVDDLIAESRARLERGF